MTTKQLTTCSSSTSPPVGVLTLVMIVPLLVAASSATLGADLDAGDPWSLMRAIVRGPHTTQEHRDELGHRSLETVEELDGLEVDPPAGRWERSA